LIKPFLAFLISIQVLFFPLPAYSQNQKAHPTGSSLEQPVIAESPPSPLKKRIQTDDLPSLPDRSRSQTARFNRGKPFYSIVIKKNKPQVQADFLLKSSPQRAWEVITDFERYKEFLKGCSASHILRKKGNQLAVKFGNSQFGLLQFDFTRRRSSRQERCLFNFIQFVFHEYSR